MKPLFVSIILLLFSVCTLTAQSYEPGSITLASGEIINGQIRDSRSKILSRTCQFIRSGQTMPRAYSPDELQGFTLAGQRFISAKPVGKPAAFMILLNEGSLSLYSMGDTYYVKPATTDSLLLLVRETALERGGRTIRVNLYRYQLDSLFRACPTMSGYSRRVDYQYQSLSKAIQQYNACTGGAINYAVTPSKPLRRVGLKVIGSYAECTYAAYPVDKSAQALAYGLGGFIQIMGDRMVNGRLSSQVEAYYLQHKFSGVAGYTQSYLCIPVLVQYALTPTRTKRPFLYIESGLQAAFSLGRTTEGLVLPPVADLVLSLPVGVGIQRGSQALGLNYGLSVRYLTMTNAGSNNIQHISLNLTVGF